MPVKKRGGAPLHTGWGPMDFTAEQRKRAWHFFQAGKSAQEIKNLCHLTERQVHWMLNVGDAERPSFEQLYQSQMAAMRANAMELAVTVHDRGLEVVKLQLENAILAERGKKMILQRHIKADEYDAPGGIIMSEDERETLKVLNTTGDKLAKVGSAYRQIYGGKLRIMFGDEEGKDKEGSPVSADFIEQLNSWSQEEMEEFARTGKEPKKSLPPGAGSKIVDAEIIPDEKVVAASPEDQRAYKYAKKLDRQRKDAERQWEATAATEKPAQRPAAAAKKRAKKRVAKKTRTKTT